MSTPEQRSPQPSYRDLLTAYARARETFEGNPNPRTLAVLETGLGMLIQELGQPGTFALGQMVMTPGANMIMREARQMPIEFLLRHKNGNWDELPPGDVQENGWSLEHGARLFSVYRTCTEAKLWVITEWDRAVTALLLPDEY